ncbi:MAG: hypothetical protein JWM34_3341 [Ilumatobacteraceae bacterium]|nr:hypothetical protein [Ilumatobacteraceae bacterium]
MESGTAIEFAHAARALTMEAQRRGLIGPSYRCPPRVVGVDRTLRRHAAGTVIAVRLRGRAFVAVLADMIEGVVVANGLNATQAIRLRGELWETLGYSASPAVNKVA